MKVSVDDLIQTACRALEAAGCPPAAARITAEHYVDAERLGKQTHGLSKFCKELAQYRQRDGEPVVVRDTGACVLLDGQGELGPVGADLAVRLVIERARRHGIALVGLTNIQRYGMLDPWARRIAEADLVGIVTNSCEPAVAPFGGTQAVLGTNPLAAGFPTSTTPLVIDMATAKAPMSRLLLDDPLPEETFLNGAGDYTTTPAEVRAVDGFGEHRGFLVGLVLQLLTGSLLGTPMGSAIRSPADLGYFFVAVDPARFGSIEDFKRDNSRFLAELRHSRPKNPAVPVRLPGEESGARFAETARTGLVELGEDRYREFLRACRGDDV